MNRKAKHRTRIGVVEFGSEGASGMKGCYSRRSAAGSARTKVTRCHMFLFLLLLLLLLVVVVGCCCCWLLLLVVVVVVVPGQLF